MKGQFAVALLVMLCACQGNQKNADKPYVLTIRLELYGPKGSDVVKEAFETDTVQVGTPLAAYSKGIQKYAAELMRIQQFQDSIKGAKGLSIMDNEGADVVPTIPQHQRDSVIMNFIQFARRSDIPYYDRVKDFELKLMLAR